MMFLKIYLGIGVMYTTYLGLNNKFHFIKGEIVEKAYEIYDTFTFKEKLLCRVLEATTYPFLICYNTYHILKGDWFE